MYINIYSEIYLKGTKVFFQKNHPLTSRLIFYVLVKGSELF